MHRSLSITALTFVAAAFTAAPALAQRASAKAMIVEHVEPSGRVDQSLAQQTGWNSLRGLAWQMLVVDEVDGSDVPADPAKQFRTNQAFKFQVEAYTDLWVYVMNVEPNGKMVTLLPEEGEQHLLVKAGTKILVPPDGRFRFVGEAGVEQFRIVASPTKLNWINPEALWKLDAGEALSAEERQRAQSQAEARGKSLAEIVSRQQARAKQAGDLQTKSLPDLVAALKKDAGLKSRAKAMVVVPVGADDEDVPVADRHRQEAISVSDQRDAVDAIVVDIQLKHGR
jgi:hypothetical protein